MADIQLAVCLDDLRLDVKAALRQACAIGFRAIEVAATAGPVSPGELSWSGKRHLLKHLSDLGLRLASLRGPVGGPGYADPAEGERRLETLRKVLAMAVELHVGMVSTSPGAVSGSDDPATSPQLCEALALLAAEADRSGVVVAIETCEISAVSLNRLLASVGNRSLSGCCDSGAMLIAGDDPHAVAETLAGRIRLVRARDAVPPEGENAGREVVQGEGDLDIRRFLAALRGSGFGGDIVLTRTTGSTPAADLLGARRQYEELLGADTRPSA